MPVLVPIGLVTGILLFAATQMELRDLDLYWHIRAGAELLSGTSPQDIGTDWSFAPDAVPWVTTQWLAEVAMRLLYLAGGWSALVAFRAVTAAIATAILAHGTLKGRSAFLASFPFVIAAAATIASSQERPNQATLIGAAVLGPVLFRALATGRVPRWWLLLPGTWLWANFHGGWILVPGVLILVSIARVLDHGLRDKPARLALALGVASAVAGTLTPAGLESTLAVVRFSAAAELISEWRPTIPMELPGLLTVAMGGLIAIAWAKSPIPRSEVLVTLALFLFSWAAIRNIAPALLVLAPLAAERLCVAFPSVGRDPEPRWSAPVAITVAGALLFAGLATIPGRNHLPTSEFPVSLARQIGDLPGQQRVLNHYNTAGLILFFGDPQDQVGIDGRTDRYGSEYLSDYTGLSDLAGDWESLLSELDPTVALLEADSALTHVLITEQGWQQLGVDGAWVLLSPPLEGR